MRRATRYAAALGIAVTTVLAAAGCGAESKVASTMDDTIRQVRDRVATVAQDSESAHELADRIRDGQAYTLLILDATAEDIESTKPFPSTAIVSLRTDDTAVSIDLFTTGQGSEQRSWFGGDSVNLVGCARITARPGGQTTASGTECGRAVDAVFTSPWEQVRLHP